MPEAPRSRRWIGNTYAFASSRTCCSNASSSSAQPRCAATPAGLFATTQRLSRWMISKMLPEEVDLHLLVRERLLRIGEHVRAGQEDHLGALRVEIQLLDQRERVREVHVVVGDAVED